MVILCPFHFGVLKQLQIIPTHCGIGGNCDSLTGRPSYEENQQASQE